jgi:hypothetical protein
MLGSNIQVVKRMIGMSSYTAVVVAVVAAVVAAAVVASNADAGAVMIGVDAAEKDEMSLVPLFAGPVVPGGSWNSMVRIE